MDGSTFSYPHAMKCSICDADVTLGCSDCYITNYIDSGVCKSARLCQTCHVEKGCPTWPVGCISCGNIIESRNDAIVAVMNNKDVVGPQARMTQICCSTICKFGVLDLATQVMGKGKVVFATFECNTCKKQLPKMKRCGRCGFAYYCSVECQRKDWPRHKEGCMKASVSSDE